MVDLKRLTDCFSHPQVNLLEGLERGGYLGTKANLFFPLHMFVERQQNEGD